jgi:hypothetical protein
MQTGIDSRSVVIKEYTDPFDKKTLRSITMFHLPPEEQVDLDDISQQILSELETLYNSELIIGLSGHEIQDTRTRTEIGAGAFTQEIILSLIMNVGYDGAKSLCLRFANWLRNKYAKEDRTPVALSDDIESVKRTIQAYYDSQGELKVVEQLESIVFIDQEGIRYKAERLLNNQHNLRIEKLEDPH